MELFVGTSGYSYKEWKGKFYPKDLAAAGMLNYYAGRFGTVEINNSFHRMPQESVLQGWAKEVPADFRFVLKAPQRITHFQRLKSAGETLAEFLEVAGVLKKRLGPLFFQLPGNFRKDVVRLDEFLAMMPKKTRVAFEFRHPSWLDQEIFDLLRKRKVALCIADADDSIEIPFLATTDWGYLRLRRPNYGDTDFGTWHKQIRKQDWREAFVFFKHEDQATGPKFAERFLELAK